MILEDGEIQVRTCGMAERTRSGRGIDRIIATRAFEQAIPLGWIEADQLLEMMGRRWRGSPRLSGPVRRIAADLGFRITQRNRIKGDRSVLMIRVFQGGR